MSYLLFMDESGQEQGESPYEVLAGVCVEDLNLWNLICQVKDAEIHFFGQRIADGVLELKAKKLLKRKTFRHAAQLPPFEPEERSVLAKQCLDHGIANKGVSGGGGSTQKELTALAQAKLAFVKRLLELCSQYRVHAFASIVKRNAPRPQGDFLRKDYAYLFERYYYFLDKQPEDKLGLVVFDELERVQAHILVDQMSRYFRETAKGKMRSSRIIPEPFFVHSHLTTAIQLADIIAYIIAWGMSVGSAIRPARTELSEFAELINHLRYKHTIQNHDFKEHTIWSFAIIEDLRPKEERE